MSLINFIQKWKLPGFLIAFFFLRFPSIYLFPPIRNSFLTTQSLARVIFLGLFLVEIYLQWRKKSTLSKIIKENKLLVGLIFLFFFELSLGVFYAINTTGFLMRYKDVFLGIILFFLGITYGKNLDKIAKVILAGLIISLIYQAIIFLFPDLFLRFANIFVYDKHLELVSGNLDRGRIYIETFDESIVLILIWWLFKKYPIKGKTYSILLLIIVGYFSLISNFRTRILILAISLAGYLIYEYRKRAKKVTGKMRRTLVALVFMFFALFISGMFAEFFAIRTFGFSFVDRLSFSDTKEDVETVYFRLNQFQNSWDLAGNNHGLGIGLGNYYESLPFSKNYPYFFSLSNDATIRGAAEYVHNIFGTFLAEGGFWAGILFLAIVLKFITDDVRLFKKGKGEKDLLIFSFWGLFVYAFLNPFVPFVLQGLFWLLRGLIIADGKS